MLKRKYKVKKSLSGPVEYRSWEDYSIGDIVIGEFVGTQKDNYDKDSLKVKVEEAMFKDGSGDKLTGKTLIVNSCGSIAKALPELALGDIVQVEYTGKSQVAKGKFAGRDCHTVSLDVVDIEEEFEEDEEL